MGAEEVLHCQNTAEMMALLHTVTQAAFEV